jgi:hypothetical protein
MADEFKIDWKKAIEDAAIDYADAYVELQCDADSDHQREHREALRDLRETVRRGLECAAAPQPAAQPDPCFCDRMKLGEPGVSGVSCGDCPTRDYKQTQPERQPMTDDQITKLLDRVRMQWVSSPPTCEAATAFVRAVEAFHGIKKGGAA